MTEREANIRALVARLTTPESNVSPEYPLLNIADTQFLLGELSALREQQTVLTPAERAEVQALLRGDLKLPREPGGPIECERLSEGLLAKFK